MPATELPIERLDNLARQAATRVFREMAGEEIVFERDAALGADAGGDLFAGTSVGRGRFFSVVVGFFGDADGKVMISLPQSSAEQFAQRLFDTPSLDWLGEDPAEALRDALGELGNMLAGLVKGGLTQWFPRLMLTPPKVLSSKRLRVEAGGKAFRKQYVFRGLGDELLIDVCCG